ncbi:MAG: signal recognition particle-docking protein FtsY [archaeon]
MFENLKKKLKKAIFGISKKIEEPEPEAEEEQLEELEQEVVEDAQAEAEAEELLDEGEKAEAIGPVEDEVKEAEIEEVIEETLEEEIPEAEIELEKETEEIEEIEQEIVKDAQAEEEVGEIVEEIQEPPKSKKEKKQEKKTEALIEAVLEEKPDEKELEAAKKELEQSPILTLSDDEQKLIQDAEKEAEAEIQKHKEILKKEGEGFFKKLFKKKEKEKAAEKKPEKPKATLLERLRSKKLTEKDLDGILWDLELALLENDVAKEVTEKINEDIKKELVGSETSRKSVQQIITDALKKSVDGILRKEPLDIIRLAKEKKEKPQVILFFGFNGTGKTMTIGKFAKLLKDAGLTCVMAAGDTFRAAAIEQLEVHAKNLNVPIIKQQRGSDSAAVIYDAIEHAKAKKIDVVLADTAGRSNTNVNLMDELKKVVRVNKPDLKIFVGDALTGNDAADQAKVFHDTVGIDAAVLTKIDCDAKGGACLSVSYVTDAPIIYLGTGQDYVDMEPFEPEWFLNKVF